MAQTNLDPYDRKSPSGHAERTFKKQSFLLLFIFSSILRRKSILCEYWFYRNTSHTSSEETEHIMHRTFSRHRQIYNIFNCQTQRDKKSVQRILYFLSLFCSTNWQWKRQRE